MHGCFSQANGRNSSRETLCAPCTIIQREIGKLTVIFTNVLLQFWGVISGLLKLVHTLRHKHFNPFPIYNCPVLPLVSGLLLSSTLSTFFIQQIPNSHLHICPRLVPASAPSPQVTMGTRNLPLKHICQRQPSSGIQLPLHLSHIQADFQS